jgi:hypothetical protein
MSPAMFDWCQAYHEHGAFEGKKAMTLDDRYFRAP